MKRSSEHEVVGQGMTEYALLLALIALVVIAVLSVFGPALRDRFGDVLAGLEGTGSEDEMAYLEILNDFRGRIQGFYDENGHWPRSWNPYCYTDIGLDPEDWTDAVEGIYWGNNGWRVGLANRSGDDIQLYVRDLEGNELHLYDSWNIWCPVEEDVCYYHTVAPGNEVDITTLRIVYD